MNNLQPYTKYKPSGIAWLGEIPEHWTEFKPKTIGYLFGGLSGKSADDFKIENEINVSPYIPFTNIANNFIIDTRKFAYVKTLENEKQNLVRKNDLLFLMSSENFEDIGKTSLLNDNIDGLFLNSFCKGFRIQNENFDSKFLNYLFSADINRKRLSIQARGFTRINLKIGKINDLSMFAPQDKNEQIAIAAFLDFKLSKIDRFIRKKKQLIKLLGEQKAGIINHAVTKGLDPNAKMKPSGIEWLGDIPEHWEVRKLKYSVKLNQHRTFDNSKSENTKIALENIESKTGRILELSSNVFEGVGTIFKKGDVLFGKLRPYLAKAATPSFEGSCVNELLVLTPHKDIWHSEFLKYRILATDFISLVDNSTYGAKMPRASWNFIGSLKVSSPSIKEQLAIVSGIEEEHKNLNKLIFTIEKEITLTQEYKTALIAEAVTGKIDVRDFEIPETLEVEPYEELEEELSMVAEDEAKYDILEKN